jgi:hypothetical protein
MDQLGKWHRENSDASFGSILEVEMAKPASIKSMSTFEMGLWSLEVFTAGGSGAAAWHRITDQRLRCFSWARECQISCRSETWSGVWTYPCICVSVLLAASEVTCKLKQNSRAGPHFIARFTDHALCPW